MPYTKEQKAFILQDNGYDPSQYDFDEAGNVFATGQIVGESGPSIPPASPTTPVTPEAPSKLATAGRSTAESVIPTAAALAASLGAAALTGGASIPVQLLAGLAAGTAGGLIGSKAQEAVVPDSVKEAIFTRPEDALNPWTRAGAGLLPMLITHSPTAGIKDLAGIASKVPNMVRNPLFAGKALTDAEQAALINAGVGVGAGTGINAGMQLANGGEISLPELAAAAAGGAVFNNPRNTALNRAIGLHAVPESTPIVQPKSTVPDTWSPVVPELGPPRWTPSPELPAPGVNNPAYLQEALRAQEAIKLAAQKRQENFEANRNLPGNAKSPVEPQPEVANPYQVDIPPTPPEPFRPTVPVESTIRINELKATTSPDRPIGLTNISQDEAARLIRLQSKQDYPSQPHWSEGKSLDKPATSTPTPSDKPLSATEAIGPRDTLYKEGAVDQATSTPITPESREIARNRGVNVANEATLPANVQGLNYQPTRQVRLNPKNSDTATLGHELSHQFTKDLSKSTDPRDVTLVKRAEEFAKQAGAKTAQDIEEFIANAMGSEFSRRMQLRMTGSVKSKFKSWLKDLKDSWDYYRGNNEPTARLASLRTLTDAPYGTRKEIVNEQRVSTVQRPSSIQGLPSAMSTSERGSTSPESGTPSKANSGDEGKAGSGIQSTRGTDSSAGGSTREQPAGEQANKLNTGGKSSGNDSGDGSKQSKAGSSESREGGESGKASGSPSSSSSSSNQELSNTPETKFSQGEAGDNPAPPVEDKPTKPKRPFSIPGVRSQIDALRAKSSELGSRGKTVTDALENFARKHSEHAGKFKENIMYDLRDALGIKMRPSNIKNWLEGDSPTARRVLEHLDSKADGGEGLDLTPKEQRAVDSIREILVKIREEQNTRAGLRKGGQDPDYFPQTISREAIDVIKNKPNTAEARRYRQEYIDYVAEKIVQKSKGKKTYEEGMEQAEQLYSNLLKGFSQETVNLAKSFGPIDEAEGYGVPPSMREKNIVRRLNNYLERTSLRFAHYDAIEASPEVNEALFGKEGLITNDTVRNIYHRMGGIRPPTEQVVEGVTGIIKAAVTGTAAGIRDVVTTPFLGAQHQDFFQMPRTAIKSAFEISKNWKESFGQGLNRVHIGSLESGDTNAGWPGGLNILHRLRDVGNEVQFRNWLEQLSRTWAYSNGKVLATENLVMASKGNASKQQLKFLDDFGPEGWRNNIEDLNPSSEVIKDIATRYAESIAGTYDARGLPTWALEGPLAPLLSLNRWSIEKTNNFVKYALDPIKEGNFKPFLNQTAWLMLGGGAAIEALNELLSNKKSKLPTVEELKTAKEMEGNWKEGTIYKAIGLAALSGYFGEAANLTKLMADAHYKNSDRWYNLMVVEFAHRTASYVPHYVNALMDGDIDLAMDIANDYLSEYSQTWRVLSHQISKERKDELLSQDENRDVKIFKQLMGQELGEIPTDTVKDYSKEYQRKFHKARTIDDVAETFPKAREEAMKNAKTPEEYESAKRGLSAASYRGYPSIDNSPINAMNFNRFLRGSQGDEKANARLAESLRMKSLNQTKRQLAR